MASETDINNLIAGHLGQDEVLTAPAQGPLGAAIAQFWDTARRRTLRANTWHCARKRVALPATSSPPAFGYGYAMNLPGDFIRLVDISSPGVDDYRDYTREGNQILANVAPLNIVYVYDLTELADWDDDLAMAFSLMLASMAAVKVTGDASLGDDLLRRFEREYEDAAQADGMEDPPLEFAEDSWINARWSGGYGPVSGFV